MREQNFPLLEAARLEGVGYPTEHRCSSASLFCVIGEARRPARAGTGFEE